MAAPSPDPALGLGELEAVRKRVDDVLLRFFARERTLIEEGHSDYLLLAPEEHSALFTLLDEVGRLVRAGGKRIRPAFCYWGYRAANGEETDAIWNVAAALELFHTFALIHDDVMDRSVERRGVPTIHERMSADRDEQFGLSSAILAGDLALVLGDYLFLHSGFEPDVLLPAFRGYNRMRVEVAVGQFLDVAGSGRNVGEEEARRISSLKSGSYTVLGPLEVGATLARDSITMHWALSHYALPLGEAFQIRNDLEGALGGAADLEQAKPTVVLATARRLASADDRRFLDERLGSGTLSEADRARALDILHSSGAVNACKELVTQLVRKAIEALDDDSLEAEAVRVLRSLAELVALPVS